MHQITSTIYSILLPLSDTSSIKQFPSSLFLEIPTVWLRFSPLVFLNPNLYPKIHFYGPLLDAHKN